MGLLGNLFAKKKQTPEELLVTMLFKASEMILDKGQRDNGRVIEVVLFSSIYALNQIEQQIPSLHQEFKKRLSLELVNFMIFIKLGKAEDIFQKIFIESRFKFYEEEIEKMGDYQNYQPTKLAYKFYVNKFTEDGDVYDVEMLFKLTLKITELFPLLDEAVKLIVPEIRKQY